MTSENSTVAEDSQVEPGDLTARRSLRTSLVFSVSLVIAALSAVLLAFFNNRSNELASAGMESKATGMATVLAMAVAPSVEFNDEDSVKGLLPQVGERGEATVAVVYRATGDILAAWDPHTLAPARLPEIPATVQVQTTADTLRVLAPVETRSKERGAVLVGFSLEPLQAARRANLGAGALFSALAMAVGLLITLVFGTLLVRPIRRLAKATGRIVAEGRLTLDVPVTSRDEVGELASRFQQLLAKLRVSHRTTQQTVEQLGGVIQRISRTATTVTGGSARVAERATSTTGSIRGMLSTLDTLAGQVGVLHRSVEESATSVSRMDNVNARVRSSVAGMLTGAREISTSVDNIAGSARDIANNADGLHHAMDESIQSVSRLTSAISTVEQQSRRAAELSERMSGDAVQGASTLQRTLDGVDRIKQSSEAGASVIRSLDAQISRIDSIVAVIREVAEQTQLLSLNANIIAAQAGEGGRAFGVVADSIRGLAERTRTSASEIGDLIAAIQQESSNAMDTITASLEDVSSGVMLGQETQHALQTIVESAAKCVQAIQEIRGATVEQTALARDVNNRVEKVATGASRIDTLTKGQAQDAEQIRHHTQALLASVEDVRQSTLEQEQSGGRVGQALVKIRALAADLRDAHHQQARDSQQVMESVESIQHVVAEHARSAAGLGEAVTLLQHQAGVLRAQTEQVRAD